jgi:hypothetical protein
MVRFVDKIDPFIEKNWKYILLGILVFTLILRLKYFVVNAALWWDEAAYLSLAKTFALGTPDITAPWRARGLSLILSLFYLLGANEWFMKFLVQIASVVGVWITFKFGDKFFNKRIGLLAALLFAGLWLNVFWSARICANIFAILFMGFALLLFWEGYVEKGPIWKIILSAFLAAYGVFAYEGVAFIYPVFVLLLLITDKFAFIKNKKFWLFTLVSSLVFGGIFIYNYFNFGQIFPRASVHLVTDTAMSNLSFDRISLLFDYAIPWLYYLKWPLLIVFIVGIAHILFNLILGWDLLVLKRNLVLKKQLVIFLWIFVHVFGFGYWRWTTDIYFEPMYIIPMLPAVAVVCAFGTSKIVHLIKKHSKEIAVLFVVLVVFGALYTNVSYGHNLIDEKKDSYSALVGFGDYVNEITEEGDVIIGCGLTVPIVYYSERMMYNCGANQTTTEELVDTYNPDLFILDMYDPGCGMSIEFYENYIYEANLTMINVFFVDEEQQEPVIYVFAYPEND